MKNIFKVAFFLVISFFISCSEDEDGRDLGLNGLTHNETFYVLNNAFIQDDNVIDSTPSTISLSLSNVNLNAANGVDNISEIYLAYTGIALAEGTYSFFSNYSIETGFSFNDEGVYSPGTFLLNSSQSGLTASSIVLKVTDMTDTTIELNLEITRADGQLFTAVYSGVYNTEVPTE